MNKLILTVATVLTFAFAGSAHAAGVESGYGAPCEPIYGGGEVCVSKGQILINKTVKNPETGAFVENLSLSSDPKYSANGVVDFQLTLTNTGKETLNEVTVTDTFPSYVRYESGSGTYNEENNTLSFKVTDLQAGESRVFNVSGRITNVDSLPADQAVTCVVNQVKATSSENESSDVSQFCISKVITTTKGGLEVMPAPIMEETPATGPGLALLALIPAGVGGMILRRKAK